MHKGVKLTLAGLVVLVVAGGGEVAYIHHERNADVPVAKGPERKVDPDDDVFLRQSHANSLSDEKDLKGKAVWVSAGGQLDYYPYVGKKVDFSKSAGLLLGAEKLDIKDAVEQVAPKKTTFRIPAGDKQIFLVFTKGTDVQEYAVPVGYVKGEDMTLLSDQIFFYDDPHQLYSYWGPQVWGAIDAHQVIPGMTERETQIALGQVSSPHDGAPGDRIVDFDRQGKPVTVTFVGGKATRIEGQ